MAKKKIKYNSDAPTLDLDLEKIDAASQKESGPITVLGMNFANDEERRAHFRELLRAKLPELRNIEGFPIGSDDDIINLSDPPYYTACPNPWLNDFIAEWEEEKHQLEAEGKRQANIVVNEPYAADVSEGRSNSIYTAHSYHTKVPHPAIMRYITHYTQPGDVIFDGFCGTGMTGVAANQLNVHSICSDLSPLASFISYNFQTPINLSLFNSEINRIFSELHEELGWLYYTKHKDLGIGEITTVIWSDVITCELCGSEFSYWDCAVSHEEKKIISEFKCPNCGSLQQKNGNSIKRETVFDESSSQSKQIISQNPVLVIYDFKGKSYKKSPDSNDFALIERISKYKPSNFLPTNRMPVGDESRRNDKIGITQVHDFFFKRSQIVLSAFLEKIEKSLIPSRLKFLLTGMLIRSTKMNRFSANNYFNGGGGWSKGHINGTLYIPSIQMEVSVFEQLKGRIGVFDKIEKFLPSEHDSLISVMSACKTLIADNSIDYIFVDPPFGANFMYSELNFISEAWLGVFTNNSQEAIINNTQNKTLFEYQNLMHKSFSEFYRILKPGKWITIEFSNTAAAVWNSIQNALQSVGFVIANVSALDKQMGSFKAVTTTTAVKQDLIISCFKPTEELLYKFESRASESNVWDFVDELLSRLPVHLEHDRKTTAVVERSPKILYDRLISFYVQHGFPVPLNAQEFQSGLRERYAERDGMYFLPSQAAKYDELRKSTQGFQASLFFVDSEQGGIAWLNNELTTPQTYQELQPKWMQAINGIRKGDILPELKQILEENFIREADGKWRKANLQDDVDLAALRLKALLREFKVYVEVAQKPRGKIKEARVEALRAGFKQCYQDKDFVTIVAVGDRIPQNLLTEDEQLLQFYEIARSRI